MPHYVAHDHGPDLIGPPIPKLRFEPWTLTQVVFACTGGIAVEPAGFEWYAKRKMLGFESYTSQRRIAFTAADILELAKVGILPDIGNEEMKDRSKADALVKTFVCVQLAWFFAQCSARTIKDLPITLLELHVITHIFCAILMYILWLQKPFDVGSPYVCKDQRVVDIAAFLAIKSTTEERCGEHSRKNVQEHTVELNSVKRYVDTSEGQLQAHQHLRAAKKS
jgi:hypothetical protein